MKLEYVKFRDYFDSERVIESSKPLEDKEYNSKGIFSEELFGGKDEDNLDSMAWIDFGDSNFIIKPAYYKILKKLFKNKLDKIINYNRSIDKNGEIIEIIDEEETIEYQYIGLDEFRNNFLEILEEISNKDKHPNEYNFIKERYHDNDLFINCLAVFSSKIRPAMMVKDVLVFEDINNYFNFVVEYTNELKSMQTDYIDDQSIDLIRLPLLYKIQCYSNDIFEGAIDMLKSKKGIIRKIIFGTRINFSARNVIGPLTCEGMNNVHIPYRTFLELYKYPIINMISKLKNINYNQAKKLFNKASVEFNEEVYKLMLELKDKSKEGLKILLNRNPTINIGSILYLNISHIKSDFDDLTLSISNNILPAMGADYDGDVLNIIPLLTTKHKIDFKPLSPDNLLISKNNGTFNREFGLEKDQLIGLYKLNNL